MKIWTYKEAKNKVLVDCGLEDQDFVSPNELSGYFNEGLTEAESEILTLNEDYMLTKYFVPVVAATSQYVLPKNILANKIRSIIYANGSIIYPVMKYRRRDKFSLMALTDQYGAADDYQYLLVNDIPGQAKLELHPTSRDTVIYPPTAGAFTPLILWYIRNCARIPKVDDGNFEAEYCNPEVVAPTQVSAAANTIQTNAGGTTLGIEQQGVVGAYPGSIAYVTGDKVKLSVGPTGTLPGGLVADTVYYVIQTGSGLIKLATTLANAQAGTAIDITSAGTVFFTIQVAATLAIVNATLIDVPEFTEFNIQWAKVRCFGKDGGDPRIKDEADLLVEMKKQMIDTLTNAIPDDDDEIQADYSAYNSMS